MASFQRFLAKRRIHIPLKTIPSLVDRYESLLDGLYKNNTTLATLFKAQGCVVLDIFAIGSPWRKNHYFWIVQEFLSSSPLQIMAFTPSNAIDVRKLIAEVALAMPVPVIGFVLSEGCWNEIAVSYLLIYSGKGPSRSCRIPRHASFDDTIVSPQLTHMIQEFHEHRSKDVNQPKKRRRFPHSPKSIQQEQQFSKHLHSEVPPLTVENQDYLVPIIRDWYSSADEVFEEHSGYDYNWDLLSGPSP